MDEYIFNNVAPQRRDFETPWLFSSVGKFMGDTIDNTKEEWERWMAAAKRAGTNIRQTTGERDARLLAEAQAGALEKESQLGIDRMKSAEDLEMEKTWSMAGTRKAEAPSKNIATAAAKDLRKDEEMSLMEQAFLMSMMENLQGEDIGQAPAVVAGGGQRQWPTMMGQFAPWERQSPYRWLS